LTSFTAIVDTVSICVLPAIGSSSSHDISMKSKHRKLAFKSICWTAMLISSSVALYLQIRAISHQGYHWSTLHQIQNQVIEQQPKHQT